MEEGAGDVDGLVGVPVEVVEDGAEGYWEGGFFALDSLGGSCCAGGVEDVGGLFGDEGEFDFLGGLGDVVEGDVVWVWGCCGVVDDDFIGVVGDFGEKFGVGDDEFDVVLLDEVVDLFWGALDVEHVGYCAVVGTGEDCCGGSGRVAG